MCSRASSHRTRWSRCCAWLPSSWALAEEACKQGRRACYGPLWPAPYLKPKEIFSTPAFQPSPTSKEQGNCRASASLAPPALHPALPPQLRSTPIPEALAVARPSSTRPARPGSAVAPPLVLSPSARVAPSAAHSRTHPSAATGRPAPGGPARSALRPPPWPSPSLLPSPNGLRQRQHKQKGKKESSRLWKRY